MPSPPPRAGLAQPARWAALLLAVLAATLAVALAPARGAAAATPAEVELAERYAPVVKVPQRGGCADGIPYEPVDVDVLFANPEVALRGPWDATNIVKVGPVAGDLARGLPGYHLDFPGDALDPGCTYEEWQARLSGEAPATMYARTVSEAGKPGLIALQYWFYYIFNDWNNNHEGDWEMIQIVFKADTPEGALRTEPFEVGYSQHSSAERAAWGSSKLELVDGTHPVVYPAEGSHANFYSSNLYLMRTSAEGVGCDDTRDVDRPLRPVTVTVPTDPAGYAETQPWLLFLGRWGEEQASFFNGPTGPNLKTQWTRPITWSEESWRNTSFTVPSSGPLAPSATSAFCRVVAAGSEVLRRAKANPPVTVAVLGGLLLLLVWAFTRTRWQPARRMGIRRERTWGQLITSGWRVYAGRPRVFLGIGLIFIPIALLVTLLQWLLFQVSTFAPLVDEAGQRNAFVDGLAFGFGVLFALLGFAVVQAVTSRAMAELDAGRPVTARAAYRAVLPRLGPLLRGLGLLVLVQVVLDSTLVLIPVGVYLLVRFSMLGVVTGLAPPGPVRPLRGSWAITARYWWRVASIAIGVTGLALLAGPLAGTAALLFSSASFNLVNLISGLVYVALLPFPAIVMTFLAGDLEVRRAAREAAEAEDRAAAPA